MGDVHNLGLFVLAGWLLNLTPGPDVLCIASHALRGGVRAGMVAALGITVGCWVHVVAAALGVSALMAASSAAFTALTWAGAAYLVFMGIQLLRSPAPAALPGLSELPALRAPPALTRAPEGAVPWAVAQGVAFKAVFLKGFMTNALNPKVALFFLAFVPQFIAPGAAHPAWVFLLLGVLFTLNSLPINMGWAWLAAWASRRVHAVQRARHWLDRLAGTMFVGFGLQLAFMDGPTRVP